MIRGWFAFGLALGALACGDGTGPELTLASLTGTWTATDIRVTNDLDPSLSEDLYALGFRFQIAIPGDGTFAVEFSNPFGSDGYDGTVTLQSDSLILQSDGVQPPRLALYARYQGPDLAVTWLGTEQCGSYGWRAPTCPIPVTFDLTLSREP